MPRDKTNSLSPEKLEKYPLNYGQIADRVQRRFSSGRDRAKGKRLRVLFGQAREGLFVSERLGWHCPRT